MDTTKRSLLTLVTEAGLESPLVADLEARGLGYTVTDARGRGTRGRRASQWTHSGNVRFEIVCDTETANKLAAHLHERYFEHYAMILWLQDVSVLRADKFR
jgi:hypothetical protein